MYSVLNSNDEFKKAVEFNKAVLIYFSHEECNVCKVLKPKINEFINDNFPKIALFFCDTIQNPQIAAQNSIFTVPTLIIFLEGKEYIRKSRNFGIEELKEIIERPYNLLFA